ncbi:MAG: TonB-dependent receptor plug domain-containing protein, partial [Sphingomonadaceae bacterium]
MALHADYLRTNGIDAFAPPPRERDGFDRLTLHARALVTPAPGGELGLVARYARSDSAFDGSDPVTFRRTDTLDATRVESLALRGHARVESLGGRWSHQIEGQFLDTSNRNRRAGRALNRTEGERFQASYLTSLALETGAVRHRLSALAQSQEQRFRARDTEFFGGTDQDRARRQDSLAGEWRLDWEDRAALQASIRHDWNDRFRDATVARIAGAVALGAGLRAHAGWGEGVADPTFTEQFGFFPGSFVGNPDVRPERQRGWEAGLEWAGGPAALGVTYYRARLKDEIITTFDFATFRSSVANAGGTSRRQGVEVTAALAPAEGLRLDLGYAWLDATQQRDAGGPRTREIRRPRHSASAVAS